MAENMRLYLELMGKSGNLRSELRGTQGAVRSWSSAVKREFQSLRNAAGSLQGQLAALGIGVSVVRVVSDSAKMDKALVRTKQTAGMTAREMALLRKELWAMSRQTGQPVEELKEGFDGLVASGMKFKSAIETIKAINIGSAVSGAPAQTLGKALTVASTAFNFDLEKPEMALELLDKMTVAGRQGNLELADLSATFGRIATNAKSAGMGFEQTLAFAEALSKWKPGQPEQLGTLVDSTLRVFTNTEYMKDAQKASGVRFFDKQGKRRDPVSVLEDIKKKYDTLKTDAARSSFIGKAFGKADQDTRAGIMMLMDQGMLLSIRDMARDLDGAGGTLKKNLDEATNNLVDQANMLKNDLKEAADNFVRPMNKTLASWIKWAREPKENGGGGIDGKAVLEKGIPAGIAAAIMARLGIKAGIRIFSGGASLAGGVVGGKALEEVAGVQPVFVVNMPGGGIPGAPGGRAPLVPMLGSMGALAVAAGVVYVGNEMMNDKNPDHFTGFGADSGGDFSWAALFNLFSNKEPIKNEVNLNVSISEDRTITSGGDPNTKVNVKTYKRRGEFRLPNDDNF